MKIKVTSKRLAFVLVVLLLAALMPTAIRPTEAANPDTTDWIPDQIVSADTQHDDRRPSITTGKNNELFAAYEHYNSITTKYR